MKFENTIYRNTHGHNFVAFDEFGDMPFSSPKEFDGPGQGFSPEELFIASVNTCLSLTFAYFAKKFKIEYTTYKSTALGTVSKGPKGYQFTDVQVNAQITLFENQPQPDMEKLAHLTESYCLISQSLRCPVSYNLSVVSDSEFGLTK